MIRILIATLLVGISGYAATLKGFDEERDDLSISPPPNAFVLERH